MPTERSEASNVPGEAGGALEPLRDQVFRVLWVATLVGNIGSFIRDVASAWIITDLSASPAAVAAIQAAATLPVFLLAVPAGALSDILDRRRLLIAIQLLLFAVSACLALLSWLSALTIPWLLLLTLLGGVGGALMGPTWQAIVPELVPRPQMRNAVALNSLGINVARAVGPAAGGLLLGSVGVSLTYGVDVITYVLVIAALLWWRRAPQASGPLKEHFFGAMRAGLRYARGSRELHRVLWRALGFFACASALWALLPLVARQLLNGTASLYGMLLGMLGLGAIVGALVLPRLRARLSADALLLGASLALALAQTGLAFAPPRPVAFGLLLLAGLGWIVALTTLNSAAQAVLPNWVRGRGMAIYLTVFNGAMTIGSLSWGGVAQWLGMPIALIASAMLLAWTGLSGKHRGLPEGALDLEPARPWPDPPAPRQAEDRGPVMVQVEYLVQPEHRNVFVTAMKRLSQARRRDGAYAWGLAEDLDRPEVIVEWFLVESWLEHLRQHERASQADAEMQREALRWHSGSEPPVVRHWMGFDKVR